MYRLILILISAFCINISLAGDREPKIKSALLLVENAKVMENIKVPNLNTNLADSRLTPAEVYINQKNIEKTIAQSVEQMKTIKWKRQFARAYAKAFTLEELNQLSTYYLAPETSAAPAKLTEFIDINQSIVNKEVDQYIAQIKQELEETFTILASE